VGKTGYNLVGGLGSAVSGGGKQAEKTAKDAEEGVEKTQQEQTK